MGTGAVMSAAVVILAGGTGERTVTKHTSVMVHQVSSLMQGTVLDITTEQAHVKQLQEKLFGCLAECSNRDVKFWKKNCKINYYMSPEQCLEYGLIDRVI